MLVSGSWGSHHSFGIMLSDIYTSKHNNMVDLCGCKYFHPLPLHNSKVKVEYFSCGGRSAMFE